MKAFTIKQTAFLLILAGCIFSCAKKVDNETECNDLLANYQDCDLDKRLVCENGSYFLVENNMRCPVDNNVITVKLNPEEEIGEEFEVIRSNRLGFIDLSVPEGVDVLDYVCLLQKTGKFELVELNYIIQQGF